MDPNIAALIGSAGGNDQFTKMLLAAINPNAARDLSTNVGTPNVSPLLDLASRAPAIQKADSQPALAGPQMMQALGFGMASASGRPGATALSGLGEGGKDVLSGGASASERAIREASQENQAALAEWEGRGRLAQKVLDTQMKAPELDLRMMDLTGQSVGRDQTQETNALYRAGLLKDSEAKSSIAQQNADTNTTRAGIGQQRADTYDTKVAADAVAKQRALALQEQTINQKAEQFSQKLLEDAKARGQRIGIDAAHRAAIEFKSEMQLRKNSVTGELPDESVQAAIREGIAQKYMGATGQEPAPGAEPPTPNLLLKQARDAIAGGADPAKVSHRLQALGIDPSVLAQ